MNKSYTLKELAERTQSKPFGDENYAITGIDELETATSADISFLSNPKYVSKANKSKAGAICVDRSFQCIEGRNYLINDSPSKVFQTLVELFLPQKSLSGFEKIHPTAIIHKTVKIGKGVSIGPYVVIDQETTIGDDVSIGSHVSIGPYVSIGNNSTIHPNVTIRENCDLQENVILQPGCVIGSCGYGYHTSENGNHSKIQHLGKVIIEADVEVGANTTIDRGRFKSTVIGKGTKIDNLVMIAHNVTLGKNNLIVSQTGIAGSTKVGNQVVMGGQCGIIGHISICDGAILMARSSPIKSVKQPGVYGGAPAVPGKEFLQSELFKRNLPKYFGRLKKVEEQIKSLQNEETSC